MLKSLLLVKSGSKIIQKKDKLYLSKKKITSAIICRLLSDIGDTVKLAEEFQSTGISAIAVHGRQIHERPQHANNTGKFEVNATF